MHLLSEYTYSVIYAVYERLTYEQDYPPTTLQLVEEVYLPMQEAFAMHVINHDLFDIYNLNNQLDLLEALRKKELPEPLSFEEVHYITRMLNLTTFENRMQGVW